MPPASRIIDWEAIEREYRAGQLSIREIGRVYSVSDAAIRKKAAKEKWVQDLSQRVKEKVRIELVRTEVRTPEKDQTDREIVAEAARRGVELVLSHRKDLARLRELETKLLDDLENKPTKLYIAQYQGEIVEKTLELTVTEKSTALSNLASVRKIRIQLERQAFDLDDDPNRIPGEPARAKEDRDAMVAAFVAADD